MLFRRRDPLPLHRRMKHFVLPPSGWRRALRYFGKRVLRLSGSPHAVAIGFAIGIFIAWSPFFGFHYLIAAGLTWIFRGNLIAAILSCTLGNPLTLPAMWALAYQVGDLILGVDPALVPPPEVAENLAEKSWGAIVEILMPVLLGSIPLGLVTGGISYFIVRAA